MNSQAAKRLAQKHLMKLEYTNYDEAGAKRMWYLSISTESPFWSAQVDPVDFGTGELYDLTKDQFLGYIYDLVIRGKVANGLVPVIP